MAATMGLPLNLNLPASPELVRIDPQVYHLTLSYLICNAIGRTTRECIGGSVEKTEPLGCPEGQRYMHEHSMSRDQSRLYRGLSRLKRRRNQVPGTGAVLPGQESLWNSSEDSWNLPARRAKALRSRHACHSLGERSKSAHRLASPAKRGRTGAVGTTSLGSFLFQSDGDPDTFLFPAEVDHKLLAVHMSDPMRNA